ncbi:uncharacterized protein LOC127127551 isoform X3 [Lathyrus oleraceus]|uniref:uncharacterized protein LOC127127551 isoform X3 n=1 Tax=Pisum sativum TaxID=3888 RepID=UPI0021D222C4|nr:uncharacterized protein LOC127127551 isoform X3 [Pisum sativum]
MQSWVPSHIPPSFSFSFPIKFFTTHTSNPNFKPLFSLFFSSLVSFSSFAMAENLVDGEFWLPLQFLSDDEDGGGLTTPSFSSKEKPSPLFNNGEDTLPYGFASFDFSSPVDSLSGSSETESDEDEKHMAELTRRMARSTLEVDYKASDKNLGRFVSGSPQSTLCAFGSSCRCRKCSSSSHGSPNGVCDVSSSKATWDLLHAAAGEVERMRLNQQCYNSHNKPSPITLPSKNNTVSPNHEMGYFTQHSLSHQQFQIAQMLRQQQMVKQNSMWGGVQNQCGGAFENQQPNHTAQNRGRNFGDTNGVDGMRNTNTGALGLSSSAWPTLQHAKQQQFYNQAKQQQQINNQQFGSGMRAVFLGNGSGRRESAGTGVFLPRRVDSPAASRKKPVCSTALVPARVAQALNLNLDEYVVGQPQQHLHLHRFNSISNVDNVAPPRHRGNYALSQQKHINNISRPQPAVSNEISLPKEWTY